MKCDQYVGSQLSNQNSSKLRSARIIFIFGSLELGGAERQGLYLARFLKDECGANVQIWGLQGGPGRVSQLCEEYGIPWRCASFMWPDKSYLIPGELFKFSRLLLCEKPDILLPYTVFPNYVCGLAWKLTDAKLCVWNQRDEGIVLTKHLLYRLAVWLTPYFLTNSIVAKDFLIQTYGVRPDKIHLIHNGVALASPFDDRETWRKRLGLSDDSFVACMLANIHRFKDHMTLIKAWREVLDRAKGEKNPPVLLLAGRFDEGCEELKELVKDLGLSDAVRFIGKVDDVAGLLQSVDLCVHSSKSEGLPNAVLEAMAAGLPVVATDIPGIREAVGPDVYRHLAAPGDPAGLADHVLEFLQNPTLCNTIGKMMLKRVQEEFSLSAMCVKTVSFITKNFN